MTDIEGFLTIYGHSDNLLNNNCVYMPYRVFWRSISTDILRVAWYFSEIRREEENASNE